MNTLTDSKLDIQTSIEAPVSASEAQEKIACVSGWWCSSTVGSADKVGDTFRVTFDATFADFRVTEIAPSRRTVWEVTDCSLPFLQNQTEWTGTKVVFDLEATGSGTRVTFTHEGLTPSCECYERCTQGWNFFVQESLAKFLTHGVGEPQGSCASHN
ncbi:MAG: SRPBCC domain-containing protein [Armatimonadetes bacterium]|nr:SRPBCC domain-containing protein [Armatimonadota bacterium]